MADDVTEITIFIIVMELLKAPKLLSEDHFYNKFF